MPFHTLVLLLLTAILWTRVQLTGAGRILVYPVDGSHWLNMNIVLQELHQRGHELTVVRSSTSLYVPVSAAHYTSLTVQVTCANHLHPEMMAAFLRRNIDIRRGKGSIISFIALQQELINMLEGAHRESALMVRAILENKRLIKKLRDSDFDLILTDPGFGGGVILGAYLGLPMVFNARWITNGEGHFAIAPSPLSYIPAIGSHVTDKMTFMDRMKNILHYSIGQYIDYVITRPVYQDIISEFVDPNASIYSLIQAADLWLMRIDFAFEFPRPTMPNVVYMGGFQCKPSKPLPAELERFVQSSGEHGVVVMSLGSLLGTLGPDLSEVIASAFARLPQKVVWRHTGPKPSTTGNNTMIMNWLPQNDLLGHPKTKAFVTHGGTNGIYEAIYHGVPMLGIPLVFDQFDNMLRLQVRGVAQVLDITAMHVDTLTQMLTDILDEKQPYGENMRRLSQIHHDTPLNPLDTGIFWLEFVMRHKGAAHLRTDSYQLPWYAYHNMDVLALVLAGLIALCVLCRVTCKALFKLLQRRKVKQQ